MSEHPLAELERSQRRYLESEAPWHPEAVRKLRDLAVESGIPLSSITRAAAGEIYYQLRVPDRVIEEYKKWRAVYDLSKRLKKSL